MRSPATIAARGCCNEGARAPLQKALARERVGNGKEFIGNNGLDQLPLPEQIAAHRDKLMRYARVLRRREEDREDLVQRTMLRALSRMSRFYEGTDLRAWLFTIMHNEHVNEVRRWARHQSAIVSAAHVSGPMPTTPVEQYEFSEVMAAIDRMPVKHAELLKLAIEGREYEEMAEIVGAPIGTVRSRLSRARDRLEAEAMPDWYAGART